MIGVGMRRLAAELIGTALLVATVVGSGIMAETLAAGNVAVALLGNTIATGAILYVLITVLGPVSGAHFNPAVSVVFALRREIGWGRVGGYAAAQVVGGIAGTLLAHAMFGEALFQLSLHARSGGAQWLSEGVATFALVFTILGALHHRSENVPVAVALVIVAGYWFTASTSFANPAVTIARALSNTFAGIAPGDVPAFILAQFAGALAALGAAHGLFGWTPLPDEQPSLSALPD
ncbi:aquaporin family protein [Novosphingobium flavum]|uniref:Aquaporin family protein n=1 Tax=Novosphingobium flavum TaxID=1778672 RepID=A0A7X1FTD8_9SPHN|nr:MIP/aquaporin family protein [Novosphingobium flavum]MBC2666603.1 aquaporin family protein [Novosphingobium flavum]